MSDTDEPIEVQDAGRTIRFVGRPLAFVSSERSTSPRWTEITIFRTTKGMYVVSRVGESRVYHTDTCQFANDHKLPYFHEMKQPRPLGDLSACTICRPDRLPQNDNALFRVEVPRQWAGVADTPSAVVEMLHRTDASGGRHLPALAASVLSEAATADQGIASAYSITIL